MSFGGQTMSKSPVRIRPAPDPLTDGARVLVGPGSGGGSDPSHRLVIRMKGTGPRELGTNCKHYDPSDEGLALGGE